MSPEATSNNGVAIVVGAASSLCFHLLLAFFLAGAATTGERPARSAEVVVADEVVRRRPQFGEQMMGGRRPVEGPYARLETHHESARPRRRIHDLMGRRQADEFTARPYRFVELSLGRRELASLKRRDPRSIDFGQREEDMLRAMVIPKLGLAPADASKLPRLTKYEQPERFASAVNISKDVDQGQELAKSDRHRKAQTDRQRKKAPSLSDLIDAPDDDDPRKRATRIEEIVGLAEGSVHGEGTAPLAGNLYLGQVEAAIRGEFKVPVFLTRDDLKGLVVDIEVARMDSSGAVLSYRLRRKSNNSAFDSAATEAIRRFVPAEGGSGRLPEPPAEMLGQINQRGILVRLEGRKLK